MFLLRLVLLAVVIFFVPQILPGFHVTSIWAALFFAFVLGLINAIIRPVLVFLTLPISILTLGLFLLFINAFTFWLASALSFGIEMHGFGTAFWGGIIVGSFNILLQFVLKDRTH